MLLLRDDARSRALDDELGAHVRLTRESFEPGTDLVPAQAGKLRRTLEDARGSRLYAGLLTDEVVAAVHRDLGGAPTSDDVGGALRRLPFLAKRALSDSGQDAFTRPLPEFLHYYESSGTTGHPAAAPKCLEDLAINTVNIGEMWSRVLRPGDVAMILINAPFAPAAYQFEKVLEYLGVMSFRPWVDNVTGNYTRVLRLLAELGTNVFVGPPSRLLEMIQFAARENLPAPRFDRLLLMAEQTGPSFVRHLERLTGGTAYVASYGSSETGTTAVTCEHRSLHLQLQSYLLELDDDEGTRLVDGRADRGELVVTSLDMPSRPLIRYRTGDLVEIDDTPCPCGVATPVLRTLGRAQDVLGLSGNGVRQTDVEAALWDEPVTGAVVFNYMLVLRGESIVCLVTCAGDPDGPWTGELAERLDAVFDRHRVTVTPVDVLPPLASLGQYLGWKLSRVLDLNDQANWDRLPAPLYELVRASLQSIDPAVRA